MAGQNKPNLYEHFNVFVTSQAVTANFNSGSQDLRKYQAGTVKFEWSGFDGSSTKVYLEISNENTTDDAKWCKWSGACSECTITTAAGTCFWELNPISPCFMRLVFEIGDGTTATITAGHVLGY